MAQGFHPLHKSNICSLFFIFPLTSNPPENPTSLFCPLLHLISFLHGSQRIHLFRVTHTFETHLITCVIKLKTYYHVWQSSQEQAYDHISCLISSLFLLHSTSAEYIGCSLKSWRCFYLSSQCCSFFTPFLFPQLQWIFTSTLSVTTFLPLYVQIKVFLSCWG